MLFPVLLLSSEQEISQISPLPLHPVQPHLPLLRQTLPFWSLKQALKPHLEQVFHPVFPLHSSVRFYERFYEHFLVFQQAVHSSVFQSSQSDLPELALSFLPEPYHTPHRISSLHRSLLHNSDRSKTPSLFSFFRKNQTALSYPGLLPFLKDPGTLPGGAAYTAPFLQPTGQRTCPEP